MASQQGGLLGGINDVLWGSPSEAASQQQQSSIQAGQVTAGLNRPNQNTPWGSLSWTQGPDGQWTSNVTLSPEQKQQFDLQNQLGTEAQQRALDTLGGFNLNPWDAYRTLQGSTFDPGQMNPTAQGIFQQTAGNAAQTLGQPIPGVERVGAAPTSDQAYRQQIQDALYQQQQSRLDPRFQQASSDLESRLAAQGITQGSDAYNREVANLGRERTDAYQQAMNNAISGGEAAVQGQFGRELAGRGQDLGALNQYFQQGLAGRQQALGEYGAGLEGALGTAQAGMDYQQNLLQGAGTAQQIDQARRNQAIAELIGLKQGQQVEMPTFGAADSGVRANIGAAPYMDAYNTSNEQTSGLLGGIGKLAKNIPIIGGFF